MTDIVAKATKDDLDDVLAWLEHEYIKNDEEGFWCNKEVIRSSFNNDELWVIRRDGIAVAFNAGMNIFCVREDLQRQGLGSRLWEAILERATRDDMNVLYGESQPQTSYLFWQKHGFERYGKVDEWSWARPIPIRRLIERPTRRVDVTISFYPEAALHDRDVAPVATHELSGVRTTPDSYRAGAIFLDKRVIGLAEDGGCYLNSNSLRDLVVRVVVEGRELCFCKAKYEEARDVGVTYGGNAFYLDEIFIDEDDCRALP